MKVTITNYNWSNEESGCWDIHFENKTGRWVNGKCCVVGTATLKKQMFINRLSEDNLIDECVLSAAAISCSPIGKDLGIRELLYMVNRIYSKEVYLSEWELYKGILMNKAIDEFYDSYKQIIEKSSFFVFDGLFGGNESSFHSAKNKIMKEMRLDDFNRIYAQLKSYLKSKKLI